jgi:molybdopterin molybdotransferase
MISVEEAQKKLLALASPLSPETLKIEHSYGRYLTRDILAKRTQPSADLSAMDGYAVRIGDLTEALNVIGESAAGKPFSGTLGAQQAVRIYTGAHIPCGADCVVIQEDVSINGQTITLCSDGPAGQGAHIRRTGTDFSSGQRLLSAGQLMNAGAVATAIMGGYGALDVGRIPKIAVIGSGDELVSPGYPANSAQIPASNNQMICAMLKDLPCEIIDMGIVGDNVDDIISSLNQCADADIIVTSGGASVGDYDLMQTSLSQMDAQIGFWRVAIKPGKPVMAGRLGKSIILGLPGNPGSAFVTAYLFLLPLVRHLSGCSQPFPPVYQAHTLEGLPATGSRTEFLRAILAENGIRPLTGQDSGHTTSLAAANSLIIRPAHSLAVKIGALVTFHMM